MGAKPPPRVSRKALHTGRVMLAVILASPCILWVCLLAVMGLSRVLPDLLRRHRRAVRVMNTCAEKRAAERLGE